MMCSVHEQEIAAALDTVVAADGLEAAASEQQPAGGPALQLQVCLK